MTRLMNSYSVNWTFGGILTFCTEMIVVKVSGPSLKLTSMFQAQNGFFCVLFKNQGS